MERYIGEVTTVKRNIETGEIIESTEYNTQTNGLLRNLTAISNPMFTNSNTNSLIYISDNVNVLTRQSNDVVTTAQTFSIGGTAISGEFWPQYSLDTINNRAIYTFKQRFQPPGSGTRIIRTIGLYSPQQGSYFAALKLQTPCNQNNLEILDVFYKIYIYYDPAISNENINTSRSIANNLMNRWFYSNSVSLYAEGTSTVVNSASGTWFDYLLYVNSNTDLRTITSMPIDNTLSQYGTQPVMYNFSSPTNTFNQTQGTALKTVSLTTANYVGWLINKIAIGRWDYGWNSGNGTAYSAVPILSPSDSRIQSVYLKSANSTTTNFSYLDPSTIGSSTATLVLNDSTWTDPEIPLMFKLNITQGGNISTATYKISLRTCFGFANNFFNNERALPLHNVLRRFNGMAEPTYVSNTLSSRMLSVKAVGTKEMVTTATNGVTVTNVYTQNFKNFTATSSPALLSSSIQDAFGMPDGSILVVTTDAGLQKISADRTTVTQFTGIGSGVNDNVCYAAAVKHNGDIWAMFEGALAKYSASGGTWTIYNSSTPITFIHSEYNPTWNNTLALYCRKDAGGDEILLTRLNSTSLTWWSPSSPTPVNTTASGTTGINKMSTTFRADMSQLCVNLPGTSAWFIPNQSNTLSRMTFGTNSATVVSAYTLGNYYPTVLTPVQYNGSWAMRSFENSTSTATPSRMRYYNSTTLLLDDTGNPNTAATYGGSTYAVDAFPDGSCISLCYSGSSASNIWLTFPLSPLAYTGWRDYGWNSSTNQWELGNPNSKPVHNTMSDLPDGLKCSFTPTGTNDFITGERWIGYVFDGLHKDNSTTAVLNLANHTRNNYITTDLSASTVPSSALGTTIENVSMYTLTDDRYSWNGGVSSAGTSSNTTTASMRSELWIAGDFTYNFYTGQYAGTTSTGNTTCYMSMYERDSGTPTSKWAFRFRNDGYVVTEDDTARTSLVLPGANDKFTIKRVGSTITYLVNDVLVYTSAITSSNPLRFMVRMPNADATRIFYDMKVTYSDTRRILKIGNAVNQTGVYDPDYAMIESWLTAPRTTVVTIDGTPATIITDPLSAPASGQVQLLQKSGMLVFNAADADKPVTCSAMVLLET